MSSKPRTIPFVKASACGNDFLLIEFAAAQSMLGSTDLADFTKQICDRHDGVGADGVEWMYPHSSADVEIRLINADGSEAEISGNGTRCVAALLAAEQGKQTVTIQTGAGLKTCELTAENDAQYEFETEMGRAGVEAERSLRGEGGEVRGVPVSMGNPHYVTFVQNFPENWQERASKIQGSAAFLKGVNVEFVVVTGRHDVRARFFERGVGETRSSGTGSCASAAAAIATGRTESPVRVHAPGGTQTVRMEKGLVFLKGSARLVCRGEFMMVGDQR